MHSRFKNVKFYDSDLDISKNRLHAAIKISAKTKQSTEVDWAFQYISHIMIEKKINIDDSDISMAIPDEVMTIAENFSDGFMYMEGGNAESGPYSDHMSYMGGFIISSARHPSCPPEIVDLIEEKLDHYLSKIPINFFSTMRFEMHESDYESIIPIVCNLEGCIEALKICKHTPQHGINTISMLDKLIYGPFSPSF